MVYNIGKLIFVRYRIMCFASLIYVFAMKNMGYLYACGQYSHIL